MALPITGYVRVSQVRGRGGDSFISPTVQTDRIRQWAAAHGHALDDVLVELDESGARRDRPLLMEAMRRVEAGESGGIVVAKLDRFGRSLVDALALIERLEARKALFVSVADGFDLSTETGRLVLRIMLALAEFELDRIRGSFADARRSAVARGLHLSARPPAGYLHVRDAEERLSAPLVVDPIAGPGVTAVFTQRASGASWAACAAALKEAGVLTAWGNEDWSYKSVRALIGNRVYLGEARHGEFVTPGAHPPLTDEITFVRANQRAARPAKKLNGAPTILQGLMRCGTCRYAMSSANIRRDGQTYRRWICIPGSRTGGCDQPAAITTAAPIERYVLDAVIERMRSVGAKAGGGNEPDPEYAAATEALDGARRDLESYRDSPSILDALGADRFAAGLRVRAERADAAERELVRLASAAIGTSDEKLFGLAETLPGLDVEEQQEIVRSVVQSVFIRPGRSRHDALSPAWVRIAWRGETIQLPASAGFDKVRDLGRIEFDRD